MCRKHDSKSLYYPAVLIYFFFFALSVDSAPGAYASNDEGAVSGHWRYVILFLFFCKNISISAS